MILQPLSLNSTIIRHFVCTTCIGVWCLMISIDKLPGQQYLTSVSTNAQTSVTSPEEVFAPYYGSAIEDPSIVAPELRESVVLLPSGFIYSTYLGNPHEPRLGTQYVHERDGWVWDTNLGGRLGLFRWGPAHHPEGVQVDVLGGVKLRLDPNEAQDLRSADFRVDIPVTWGAGPHRFKFGYSHISSHLGDEFLLKNPEFDRVNYYRDALVLGYSYYPSSSLRLYGEAAYAFWSEVADPWRFTFGVDYAPTVPTGPHGAPFVSLNADLREEVNFGGGFTAQAGWSWRTESQPGILRTGVFYYNGESPQFSFFDEHEEQIGFGLWYDF